MYWNADSKLPKRGCAHKTATTTEVRATHRPTKTNFLSVTSLAMNCLYISMVKIVLTLLVIDANDETIAATNAAKVKPSRPEGSNDII